jgi:LCP family protein required for cell wall assembly
LFGLALVLGAVGFNLNGQQGELAQQILAVSAGFGDPLAGGPTTGATFVPPEEAENRLLLNQPTIPPRSLSPLPAPSGKLDQTLNVLLLGSDHRPGDPVWRTDVIMIVFVDAANGRAAVLSLPRDLYVDIPTRGPDRINIADFWGEYTKYPGGGPGLLKHVISDNFGIRVDKYARVDFDGFKQIVDTLGGIDVVVPCELEDDFIDPLSPTGFRRLQVDAGINHMDGETALMYVRQRHNTGDVSRAQRQQRVMFALRERLLSPDVVTRIPQLYAQLQDTIQTDFGTIDLPGLVQAGMNVKPGSIRGRVVDGSMWQFWTTPDGKSVLVFDKDAVRAAVDDLFNAPPIEETEVVCY